MASTVRSVTVRLEAMVARYIRDMNRAGDATERAFDRIHGSTTRARDSMVETDRATRQLDQSTAKLGRTTQLVAPSQRKLSTEVDRVSVAAVRGSASIDKYSGRLRLLLDLLAVGGPALLALGGAGLAGVAGLAALFGGATVGALALVGAVQGVGDALKAVEAARLDPTVENLAKAEEAMSRIAPAAREFVTRFQEIRPLLRELRDAGAEQFFPGLTASLDSLERLEPVLKRIMASAGRAGGDAIAGAAESLASERWAPFLDFLVDEIPQAAEGANRVLGGLAHAGAELWMAFDPTNDRFIDWLGDVAEGLDRWAGSAEGRADIEAFLRYVERTAPKVGDFIVAAADAFTQLVQAAAPLSGPVLEGLTAALQVVAAIADSDLGTPIMTGVAALALYTRSLQLAATLQTRLTGSKGLANSIAAGGVRGGARAGLGGLKAVGADLKTVGLNWRYLGTSAAFAEARQSKALVGMAKGTAVVGGLAVAASGAADSIGLTNTASLGLMGFGIGGPVGGALGSAAGLFLDVKSGADAASASIKEMRDAIKSGDLEILQAEVDAFVEKNQKYLDGDWTFGDTLSAGFKDLFSLGGFSTEVKVFEELTAARDKASEAQGAYNSVLRDGGRAAYEAKYGIDQLISSMEREQSVARAALDSQYAWGQAVQDIRELLKDGSRGFNEFTEAGQDNYAAISGAAEALNGMVEAGKLTNREYVQLRDQFIGFAQQLGASKTEAEEFANQLLDFPDILAPQIAVQFDKQQLQEAKDAFDSLPREVRAKIRADGIPQTEAEVDELVRKYKLTEEERKALITLKDSASARIQAILARLREVKDKSITIRTTWENFYRGKPQKPQPGQDDAMGLLPKGQADGGTVPGQRQPYGDKVLIFAAPGEEVISNRHGQADQFRADRAAGRIPAYADGGTVQGLATGGTVLRTTASRDAQLVASWVGSMVKFTDAVRASTRGVRAELKARQTTLEREISATEERIDLLRQDTDALRSSLDARLRNNIFDTSNAEGLERPDFSKMTNEEAGAAYLKWQQADAAFRQTQSGGSLEDRLRNNNAEIREFLQLEAILAGKGLDGEAYRALVAEGSIEQIRALAGSDRATVQTYQQLYMQREGLLARAGRSAVDYSGLGADMKAAQRERRAQTAELREVKAKLQRLEKLAEKNQAKDIGREVGRSVDKSVSAARAGR